LAHVDEAIRFVLFAAPDDAAYATGTDFVADGGYLLAPPP
jgi:3alpha(or 20beta)-hydroxysteroid dehydrogenase